MNDTEILTWVASHLVKFNIGIDIVEVEWIDDAGANQKKTFNTIPMETDIEILRNVVTALASQSEVDA